MDKSITVKFTGGREGLLPLPHTTLSPPLHPLANPRPPLQSQELSKATTP